MVGLVFLARCVIILRINQFHQINFFSLRNEKSVQTLMDSCMFAVEVMAAASWSFNVSPISSMTGFFFLIQAQKLWSYLLVQYTFLMPFLPFTDGFNLLSCYKHCCPDTVTSSFVFPFTTFPFSFYMPPVLVTADGEQATFFFHTES